MDELLRDVVPEVVVGALLGVLLALIVVGGLAWTVRRLPHARRPGLLATGSLAIRLGAGLGISSVLALTGAVALVSGLAAFLASQFAIVHGTAAHWGRQAEE